MLLSPSRRSAQDVGAIGLIGFTLLIGTILAACGGRSGEEVAYVDMLDCTLEQFGALHIHKNREDKSVTVITNYDPGDPDHREAVAKGRKSYGVVRRSSTGSTALDVELFLIKESFGGRSNETVTFRFEPEGGPIAVVGRTTGGGAGAQASERDLDRGVCQKR